ncbi:MAG: hypothetical protein GF307_14355 [candidate division Zixibacteria bacterium]|nr:hypothetical protein [candidate division Zixibacteria bacterium]
MSLDLGWLIDQTRSRLKIPIAVITNGSLLYRRDVRDDLAEADIIIPSLDAGNGRMFTAINRHHPLIGFDSMLQGLIDFNLDFNGKLWLEVMLVSGKNDTDEELVSLKKAIEKIQPDRVYIMTPIRPPAEPWVKCPSPDRILKAQEMFGQVIAISDLESGEFYLDEFENVRQAIKEIGNRHPLRLEQAEEMEDAFSEVGTIEKMLKANEIIKFKYNSNIYLLPARFLKSE